MKNKKLQHKQAPVLTGEQSTTTPTSLSKLSLDELSQCNGAEWISYNNAGFITINAPGVPINVIY